MQSLGNIPKSLIMLEASYSFCITQEERFSRLTQLAALPTRDTDACLERIQWRVFDRSAEMNRWHAVVPS